MGLSRRDLLEKAWRTGVALFGSASLFEILYAAGTPEERRERAETEPRLAMVVDIERCLKRADCRDCADACHRNHNVPSFADKKREIKWIWTDDFSRAFTDESHDYIGEDMKHRPVPLLCNHCDNPPCVRVCPTGATWRRRDGIVMMDMHRCIGCRYCMAACPYGSRSFNWSDPLKVMREKDINPDYPRRTKGVVEKCSFCSERVDYGKSPYCVEACRAGAMLFGDAGDPGSAVRKALRKRYAIRRKSSLGTNPQVYYLI